MWEKGEGGRIAQTLAEGLLLPEDVYTFEEGSEGAPARVARHCGIYLVYSFSFQTFTSASLLTFVLARLPNWLT